MSTTVPLPKHGSAGRRIAAVLASALLAAIALKWVWTRIAVDLFAMPEASFAQATAVVTALVAILLLTRAVLTPNAVDSAP